MRRARWVPILAVLVLLLAACGGEEPAEEVAGEDGGTDTSPGATEPAAGDGAATEAAGGGEPIPIAFLGELSGPFAVWGVQTRDAMQMAVDEINADGGVLGGRELTLIERDTQGVPEEGVTALEGLVEQEGVVAAGGIISSDVGLAVSRSAEEMETPLFLVKAGSARILSPDSRYTFRTCLPAATMTMGPLLQYLQSEGLTRAGAIVADYEWGQSVRAAMEDTIGGPEGEDIELQIEVAPVGETDFTTYLRRLQEFEPDIIVATGHPPGTGPIVQQSADLGIDVPVVGSYAVHTAVVSGVGEAALGRYADFDCADFQSDSYQELATRFVETTGNEYMEDDAVAGYGIVTMVAEAIEETGGTDTAAIAEYLHANSFELPGYAHTMSWTEWGELAEAQPLLSLLTDTAPPEGVATTDWYPETLFLPEPLEPIEP